MKKFRLLAIVPLMMFMLMPLLAAPAQAAPAFSESLQQVGDSAYDGAVSSSPDQLPIMIGNLINAALGLLGIVLLVLIIYGGYLWMTAGGNSDQVDKAKKIITNAVIGLVIIMAAYAIANFVFSAVIEATAQ